MKEILTPAAMKSADAMAAEHFAMPSLILMENAGRCVVDVIERIYGSVTGAHILVVCGKGNNGGDGFAAARHALDRGAVVTVVIMEDEKCLGGDPLVMWQILKQSARPNLYLEQSFDAVRLQNKNFRFIVDALFGTSFHGTVKEMYAVAMGWMNRQSGVRIAVDVPSGLNALTGAVETIAVCAAVTVAMAAAKPGLYIGRGCEYAGNVVVADISMPQRAVEACSSHIYRVGESDVYRTLPVRAVTAHKYSVGTLCVIAGSRGLTGAALLSAEAAMRSGAGAVTLCTPASEFFTIATRTLEVMPFAVASTPEGTFASDAVNDLSMKIDWADVLLVGPGIAPHSQTDIVVRGIIATAAKPTVIDAGGLTALAGNLEILQLRKNYPTVLTPHTGEFARLVGVSVAQIEDNKIEIARTFAKEHCVVLVLKGAPTIVAAPDGDVFLNSTGNPGMATAGSGDVLAGVIAALLAQGNEALTAALNGVYLHGKAGDFGVLATTQYGLIASDIIDQLPSAFATCVATVIRDMPRSLSENA